MENRKKEAQQVRDKLRRWSPSADFGKHHADCELAEWKRFTSRGGASEGNVEVVKHRVGAADDDFGSQWEMVVDVARVLDDEAQEQMRN